MEQRKRLDKAPSLGAYLWELRPGAACVCCGAPLRRTESDETYRSKAWPAPDPGDAPQDLPLLVCSDCGCEIGHVSSGKAAGTTSRTLNRAA